MVGRSLAPRPINRVLLLVPRHTRWAFRNRLKVVQSHSQYGEDTLLWDYFGQTPTGVCVEVGGFDGVTGSNSLFFEERGWQTVVVEPMPRYAEMIRARRPKAKLFNCAAGANRGEVKLTIAHGAEAFSTATPEEHHMDRIQRINARLEEITVPMRTMDDILDEAKVATIDFITIDVEGGEADVLAGIDLERWKPRVVILENNFGPFSLHLHRLMLRRDYHFCRRTGCNEWYLRGDETDAARVSTRLRNAVRAAFLSAAGSIVWPFKALWRASGLKAWNHRRIRARRERKRARQGSGRA